jgi:hypothetical protein
MTRSKWAVPLAVMLLSGGMATADDDPTRKALDGAKAAYDSALESYRSQASDWFDRREQAARQGGKKGLVDQIREERQAFEDSDELPNDAPPSLKRGRSTARANLEAAYDKAVKEYTRTSKDTEANAVEKELEQFRQNVPIETTDHLQPGTVWRGRSIAVGVGATGPSRGWQTLTVLEREGGRFKARLEAGQSAGSPTVVRIVNGRIKGRRLWWTKEDVVAVKGSTGVDNFGYLNHKRIRMRFEGAPTTGLPYLGVAEYQLVQGR